MPANRPNNPRAFVSPNNPSGSFKVTWTRGANEVDPGGYYFVRIAVNQGLGGQMPFDVATSLIAEFTASAHGTAVDYEFEISSSAQYQEGVKNFAWPEGVWPLSESANYEVQVTSDYEDGGTFYGKDTRWIPIDSGTGATFQTGSMGFTTSASIAAAPSEPTIAFDNKTTSSIRITWSAISGATNYKYYIGTSANPTSPGSNTGDVTGYNITSLSAGTTYYVRLKATNATGDSGYSNELTIDTLTATITDLTLSDNKPTRNDIAWTAPTGTANSYLVAGTSTNPTSVISTQSGTGAKTFEHTGLDPGDEYFYRVRTQTTNHNSQYSAYSDNESQTNPSLDLPTSLGYTAEVHNINFDFTEPATWGERVYIYDTSGNQLLKTGTGNNYITVDNSGDSNWDTSDWTTNAGAQLITGGNQSLTVKYKSYYDTVLSSFTSNVTGYSLPAPPTNLAASAASDSQIDLTWNNPTGSALSETFTIQRKPSGGTYSDLTTSATGTSYSDSDNLNASTQYYYKIRTNTSAGSSAYTSEVNATTQAGAVVPAGAGLSLGALGKAVGANGDTTSETALAADGRGSTGTQTRMQDFTTSAVSSMTVPDDTPDASTSAVATIAFANVGNLFLSRIANRAANFTWDETSNDSLFTLEETTSNYTASISYGSSAGSIAFTGKFNDSFNDHATNYNSAIPETATIQLVTEWSSVPGDFSMSVDGVGDTGTNDRTISLSAGSGNTVVTCPTGLPPNRGGQLQVAASTSSTPSSGHAASVSVSHTSSTLYMQFKLTGVSGGSGGGGSSTRAVTIVNNGVTATFNITVTQTSG